ncbi:hypothetical protein OKA04_12410 [Luteolibacter flavescens]|uniref:Tyr recombinase domain-containing protein n=1 Tax=Luteolibacter flavescens TaxID=1859460 RepID=A0ABT3FPN9_9BACT|nr:hypothetical protein [Luteolibacter flavescens]MCW1885534.1 hypothetical protein [Luteolibacter flavescens]
MLADQFARAQPLDFWPRNEDLAGAGNTAEPSGMYFVAKVGLGLASEQSGLFEFHWCTACISCAFQFGGDERCQFLSESLKQLVYVHFGDKEQGSIEPTMSRSCRFPVVCRWRNLGIAKFILLRLSDVGDEWLTIRGGEEGTKNSLVRRVPINPPLSAVILRRRYPGAAGKVFTITSPVKAFQNACTACGVPPLRVYDLRHIFATVAIESGVDILTVSRWLGHQDRGVLAMKTYGHLRDEHSLQSAKKLA